MKIKVHSCYKTRLSTSNFNYLAAFANNCTGIVVNH
jgi:hypothetical protein